MRTAGTRSRRILIVLALCALVALPTGLTTAPSYVEGTTRMTDGGLSSNQIRLSTSLATPAASEGGAGLILMEIERDTDRAKITWYNHTDVGVVELMAHEKNYADGELHRAFEIKTTTGEVSITGTNITASSPILTAPVDTFKTYDLGRTVTVPGAAGGGTDLVTPIVAVFSTSQVQLNAAASTTVTDATARLSSRWETRFHTGYGEEYPNVQVNEVDAFTIMGANTGRQPLTLRFLQHSTPGYDDFSLMNVRSYIGATDETVLDFDAGTVDDTTGAHVRFFRNTDTSGARQIRIMKGDGTATEAMAFDVSTEGEPKIRFDNAAGSADVAIKRTNSNLDISSGGFAIGGTTVLTSSRALSVNLLPASDATLTLGSQSARFGDVWPNQLRLYYSANNANEKLFSLTSNTFSDSTGGAKWSWRNDAGTARQDSLYFHKSGNIGTSSDINFGIGLSNPQFVYYPLDVNGNMRLRSANTIAFGGTGASDADATIGRGAANRLDLGSDDGLKLGSAGITFVTSTLGTCDSSVRGTEKWVFGGAGVADVKYACMKSSGDTYSWKTVVTG